MLKVYPKKGKPFDLDFHHFKMAGEEFTLHGTTNAEKTGYLVVSDIAAIMPDSQRPMSEHRDLRVFTVYLRRHLDSPLRVIANTYKKEDVITFQYRHYEMTEIYVATEDVLGITFVDAEY